MPMQSSNAAKSTYQIFIEVNAAGDNAKFQLPVGPAKIDTSYKTDNKHYDVLGIGEIVVPRLPKLKTWEWESLFPAYDRQPFVMNQGAGNFSSADSYVKFFDLSQQKKTVLRLIINRTFGLQMPDNSPPPTFLPTNTTVIVEDFVLTEKGGEIGDLYYKITFCEYRQFAPRKVTFQQNGKALVGTITPSRAPGKGG